ncbi:MAG: hypothetical protein HC913_12400 [Microscillaceae bacterium]|nr:hypothetical protein [Microscillaceae bacterium]
MKKTRNLLFLALLLGAFAGCRTIREIKNFAKSEFRIKEIDRLFLGDVNLRDVQALSDLNLSDAARLGKAYQSGNLPLSITYLVEIRNPNDQTGALEKTDWILELDETDLVTGTTSQRVEVAPNGGLGILPITVSTDVRELLKKESLASMVNLMAAIKGDNQEQSRFRLKIKPRFIIAGITIGWPGYIKVGKTFESSREVK